MARRRRQATAQQRQVTGQPQRVTAPLQKVGEQQQQDGDRPPKVAGQQQALPTEAGRADPLPAGPENPDESQREATPCAQRMAM